jgi:hypothetical protein
VIPTWAYAAIAVAAVAVIASVYIFTRK